MRTFRSFCSVMVVTTWLSGCGDGGGGEDGSLGGAPGSGGQTSSSGGASSGGSGSGGETSSGGGSASGGTGSGGETSSSGGSASGGTGSGGETSSSGGASSGGSGSGGETSSGGSAPIGPCDLPSACSPGATRAGDACGNCGHKIETCSPSCEWVLSESCAGEPENACTPGALGEIEACGFCGTRQARCTETCEWERAPACENEQTAENRCLPGESSSTVNGCGYCGTQTTSCSAECLWVTSECAAEQTAENRCSYKDAETRSEACGSCGSKTYGCTESCLWDEGGSCEGEPVDACSPSTTRQVSCGEGECGVRTDTCSEACGWTLGNCGLPALEGEEIACFPGETPDDVTCDEDGVDREILYSCIDCRLEVEDGETCGPSYPQLVVNNSTVGTVSTISFTQAQRGPLGVKTTAAAKNACGANFNTTPNNVAYTFVEVKNTTSKKIFLEVATPTSVTGMIAAYTSRPRLPGGDVSNATAMTEWNACLSGSGEVNSLACPSSYTRCLTQCSIFGVVGKAVPVEANSSVWIYVPQAANGNAAVTANLRVRVVNESC